MDRLEEIIFELERGFTDSIASASAFTDRMVARKQAKLKIIELMKECVPEEREVSTSDNYQESWHDEGYNQAIAEINQNIERIGKAENGGRE